VPSAIVSTSEKTMPFLVMVTMAQIVLSGGVVPLSGLAGLAQLSWIAPARWGFSATASTVNLNTLARGSSDPLWRQSPGNWLRDIGIMVVLATVFLLVAWIRLHRLGPRRRRWPVGGRDGGLATASSTIYNVGMAIRAMQEATFLILTALADGSQHGYGIIADVQEISGGQVQLRPGTLYTALDRLRADELIEVDREEVVDGRLRRYYRLTPEGTTRLGTEAARLQAHAAAALTRLDLAGGMAT
jgi:DNA-binding PadR family transcriptional regulator